mmetsp:Transcript_71891/g.227081  ORF Transcript_71891/g.227081 Transcript_71891/m.227081 type:complete len:244 (+) Transcript_71891:3-734(+)
MRSHPSCTHCITSISSRQKVVPTWCRTAFSTTSAARSGRCASGSTSCSRAAPPASSSRARIRSPGEGGGAPPPPPTGASPARATRKYSAATGRIMESRAPRPAGKSSLHAATAASTSGMNSWWSRSTNASGVGKAGAGGGEGLCSAPPPEGVGGGSAPSTAPIISRRRPSRARMNSPCSEATSWPIIPSSWMKSPAWSLVVSSRCSCSLRRVEILVTSASTSRFTLVNDPLVPYLARKGATSW